MGNKMTFTVSGFGYRGKVEIINRQNCVEYRAVESADNYISESAARVTVGNLYRNLYDEYFTGDYFNRKPCTNRLEDEILYTKNKLEELEFALKVTKKRVWKEVT